MNAMNHQFLLLQKQSKLERYMRKPNFQDSVELCLLVSDVGFQYFSPLNLTNLDLLGLLPQRELRFECLKMIKAEHFDSVSELDRKHLSN